MRFTTRETFLEFIDGKFSYIGMTADIYNLEKLDEFKAKFRKEDARVLRKTVQPWHLVVQGATCWLFQSNHANSKSFLYIPIVGAKMFVGSTPRCRCLHVWCPKWGRVYSFASRKKGVKIPPSKLKTVEDELKKTVDKKRK